MAVTAASTSSHPCRRALTEQNPELFQQVTRWLKAHGKVVKPKLSNTQKQELNVVFRLMDEDGSGAIDVDEMQSAFKLLGFDFNKARIRELIAEVSEEGKDEVNYQEFLEVMTVSLVKMASSELARPNQVPMALVTTAYTRKKLLERVLEGTADSFGQVLQSGEEQQKAKERERAENEERARQAEIDSAQPSDAILKVSQASDLKLDLLRDTLSPREIQALASMSSKLRQPCKLDMRLNRQGAQQAASCNSSPRPQHTALLQPQVSDPWSAQGTGPQARLRSVLTMHGGQQVPQRTDYPASCTGSPRASLCTPQITRPAGRRSFDSREDASSVSQLTWARKVQTQLSMGPETVHTRLSRGPMNAEMLCSPRSVRHWELEPVTIRTAAPLPVIPPMVSSMHAPIAHQATGSCPHLPESVGSPRVKPLACSGKLPCVPPLNLRALSDNSSPNSHRRSSMDRT